MDLQLNTICLIALVVALCLVGWHLLQHDKDIAEIKQKLDLKPRPIAPMVKEYILWILLGVAIWGCIVAISYFFK